MGVEYIGCYYSGVQFVSLDYRTSFMYMNSPYIKVPGFAISALGKCFNAIKITDGTMETFTNDSVVYPIDLVVIDRILYQDLTQAKGKS